MRCTSIAAKRDWRSTTGAGNHLPDTLYWPSTFGQRFGTPSALEFATLPIASPRAAVPDRITPAESRAAVALLAAAVESSQTGQVVRF